MARRHSLEEKLAKLRSLEADPFSAENKRELGKALRGANNALAAKAADIAAKYGLTDLIPDLIAAFERFMDKPERTDKGCLAKLAIVDALNKLDYGETDIFLQGIHHVQMEPVYGGRIDTAANLRGNCGLALARLAYADALFELTALVMDPELQARRAAAKALTYVAREECELLLRMKALAGDREPDVIGDCLSGLMELAPERSTGFVASFLDSADLFVAEGAAIALAESRMPEALEILRDRFEKSISPEFKQMLVLPIALTRLDDAFNFLLEVVSDAYRDTAAAAVEALKIYGANDQRRARIQQAVVSRDDPAVSEAYANAFEQPA